ncbi:uncharacterized protein LOC117155171 [Bombus vancouverensis nearcticus]|uniref:uncharacterized protein LOC117155171 n=1 Tax=Bombus vancouverensis nearcticus TaxID=2705178 RepID=UPI00402B0E1E
MYQKEGLPWLQPKKCKIAPNEKFKQSIRRFADIRRSPAAMILIPFFLGSKISVKFQKEKTSNFQQIRANSINRNGSVIESEIVTSSTKANVQCERSVNGV